jgi:hypothetical protein
MAEANDPFGILWEKLCPLFGSSHADIMQDHIRSYGKTEFERGHKTACTEKRFKSDTSFYDLRDENKQLKEENKELIRENVKLRGLVNDQSLTLVRMKNIKDENNYLMDKISDYEKGPKQYLKDILNSISLSGVSEEMLKGFNECKDLIDIMMYDVNSDEDLARKTQKLQWYDAEKCLPMPDSKVIIEVDHCPISDKYIKKWRYADED